MSVHIVRLGAPRAAGEGPRIGTVRRPPRGVRKEDYAAGNWFDVWYPELAPSPELMAKGQAAETDKDWAGFVRAFKAEMKAPAAARTLDVLATLSHSADFAVGGCCAEEARRHRSVRREELAARGRRSLPKSIVMAGLVPATQKHRNRKRNRGGAAAGPGSRPAFMGGRDKPGHHGGC